MKKKLEMAILTIALVFSSLSVSAQINELKQSIAESNKELPEKMNAVMTLESVKYETGYVVFTVTINSSPQMFSQIFKNRKREDLVNLDGFVNSKDNEDKVSLMVKTNTGLKYNYKCSQSDDFVEVSYSAEEIKECKEKGATDPYSSLFGMDYIKWYVNWWNEINKNVDQTGGIVSNGEMYIKDNTVVYTVLVPRKGVYEELDFDAIKPNRLAGLRQIPQGEKMLREMVKLNMSLIFLIKDVHSNKSHQIKCTTDILKEYVD